MVLVSPAASVVLVPAAVVLVPASVVVVLPLLTGRAGPGATLSALATASVVELPVPATVVVLPESGGATSKQAVSTGRRYTWPVTCTRLMA